ncbi:MAG: rRNA maturation RNase YbeY [Planctomycetia bacterium]|nr:rRNA maturation RNase YbeY [Planctomycetia bacterium]
MTGSTFTFIDDDRQSALVLDFARIEALVSYVFEQGGFECGTIELVALEPEPMHRVNVEFLGHDYPTDVLAFALDEDRAAKRLDASIIICTQVAIDMAKEYNWSAQNEAALYFVHGALHLVGYDDHTPENAPLMHAKEVEALATVGIDASRSRLGE